MALEEYRRKRDFQKTPEPPPRKVKARTHELSYLIQKHAATRLHYDFRLELDGVLLSWVVTKGPSLNPADKRLAVRTEDHPLAYGAFEGTIPKGQYGGGTVMLWDKGRWEPKGDPNAGLHKGHLSFVLYGERLKGGWDLVRMRGDGKRENWLLIKAKDTEADQGKNGDIVDDQSFSIKTGRSMDEIAGGEVAGSTKKKRVESRGDGLKKLLQLYPEVQLAMLVDRPPQGAQWLHEIKLDGYRLLGFVAGTALCLRTRNGKDWTAKFPSLAASLEKLKVTDAVLDMEAVVVNDEGKSSFHALQAALGTNLDSIVAYVFDLLYLNGRDLTKLPLRERKATLQALLSKSKRAAALLYSEHLEGNGGEMLAKACGLGLEGIVSKQAEAPYLPGRQRAWLKSKCTQRQEFIIIGYSDARTGERALGALYLGYRTNGMTKYAGKVGTGFSMKSAGSLQNRLKSISIREPVLTRAEVGGLTTREWQSIHWVKPVLLCEVDFTEWTKDGQLRHPSFQGLREDKNADDVKKEKPVQSKITSPPRASKKIGSLVLHGITITHPDRVISETGHITKGDLAEYYAAVAPFMLPRIFRHPLSLLRCPAGIDSQCFYQRNPGKGLGPDVHPFKFRHKGKKYEYLYIKNAKGLLEVVQMGSIEIHPWGASIDAIDCPDRLIFDLDPGPDVPFEAVKLAAQDLRQRLKRKGLESTLKCSGGKGLHVTVPLASKDEWPKVKSFAAAVANEMVDSVPEAYIATMSKAKRAGKIFVDYFRNDYTATAIADYSVRARPGAPVALPLDWNELKTLKSANQFTMRDVLKRLGRKNSPARSKEKGQRIPSA